MKMRIKAKFLKYVADDLQKPRVNINIHIEDTYDGYIRVEYNGIDVFFEKGELLSYLVLLSPIVEQQDKIDKIKESK